MRKLILTFLFAGSAASAVAQSGPDAAVWDLTDLFPTVEAWDSARDRVLGRLDEIESLHGSLEDGGPEALYRVLRSISDARREASRVAIYASLNADEDLRQSEPQERRQLADAMYARFSEATSWVDPELIRIGSGRIRRLTDGDARFAPFLHMLDNTLRNAPHTLGEEAERALSYVGRPLGMPEDIYGVLANADIPYPTITLSTGESFTLDSQGYARGRQSSVRADRRMVFETFWSTWAGYRNTGGMLLNAHIQGRVALARARGFRSVLERELFADNLPEEVYRTLVREVNRGLPTLHRYFRLRARMLGIEHMAYYDIYPPLVSLDRRFDLETSKAITLEAMSLLGDDWVGMQRDAMSQRWMHVYPQRGKRSGAYMSGGAYDVHPYLLLNHNDDYDSLSTLAHEWGHAMHTLYARQAQPFETARYATFIAEIPSTSVELILEQYMTAHAASVDEELYYLGFGLESLRGTFFRQTMFAEFELALYEAAERGEALSGKRISDIYAELVRRYHGHDDGVVEVDDLYTNEWLFVPHFYYNMYLFQYATSLVAGTALYGKIVDEGEAGVENYKNLLRAGGSDYPYELLKSAGVDLAKPEPYRATIARMNALMDRIEELIDRR